MSLASFVNSRRSCTNKSKARWLNKRNLDQEMQCNSPRTDPFFFIDNVSVNEFIGRCHWDYFRVPMASFCDYTRSKKLGTVQTHWTNIWVWENFYIAWKVLMKLLRYSFRNNSLLTLNLVNAFNLVKTETKSCAIVRTLFEAKS